MTVPINIIIIFNFEVGELKCIKQLKQIKRKTQEQMHNSSQTSLNVFR